MQQCILLLVPSRVIRSTTRISDSTKIIRFYFYYVSEETTLYFSDCFFFTKFYNFFRNSQIVATPLAGCMLMLPPGFTRMIGAPSIC